MLHGVVRLLTKWFCRSDGEEDDVQKRGAAPPAGAAAAPKLNPPVEAAVAEGAPNEKPGVVGAVPGVGVVLAGWLPNEKPPCDGAAAG